MAMLSNGQLRFAYGFLLAALLALGMQSDPLSAHTSDESKAEHKKEEAQVTILSMGRSVTSRFSTAHSQPFFPTALHLKRFDESLRPKLLNKAAQQSFEMQCLTNNKKLAR